MRSALLALAFAAGALGAPALAGCGDSDDAADDGKADAGSDSSILDDSGWPGSDADPDVEPPPDPVPRAPCATGQCWSASSLSSFCGSSQVNEDFSTGLYNVHQYALALPAGEMVDLTMIVTGGAVSPALIVNAADGTTIYDGEIGASGNVKVSAVSSGRGGSMARVGFVADKVTPVDVFATSWSVVDGNFAPPMPTDVSYSLTTDVDCEPPPPGTLLSPPNFDEQQTSNGYFMLPDSEPPGLYVKKGDACSWGNKLLIDVIYTVATYWKPLYPSLSPLYVKDLNENVAACTTNHDTHADGTHVDIVAGCATSMYCADKAPKIALAKLFVDTGVACGILNNDTAVHQTVNDYFAQKTNYAPWKSQFMRSVTGHVEHFHVRVKKPDGTCN